MRCCGLCAKALLMEDTAMKSRYTRILSVLLCAALACSILAGCNTAASSSEAPSSASSSQSVPASSEVLPDSTTRADLRAEPR